MGALYTEEFLSQFEDTSGPQTAFVVNLCTRPEPQIEGFRQQIEDWYAHLREDARPYYRERLSSLDNPTFFQAFSELVLHELFLNHEMKVLTYPVEDAETLAVALPGGEGSFSLAVQSFIPEVQVRGSMQPFRRLLRELKEIEHRFMFSVYLKRWLPYNFDPKPIRRALEAWLNSLEDTNWEGKYAEYRDDHIHLEFSILDRLRQPRADLVKFRITPLRAPSVLASLGTVIEDKVQRCVAEAGEDTPLVMALFGNEEWDLPVSYIEDFLYNKANFTFNWTTRHGRRERLRSFKANGRANALFSRASCRALSAIALIDKRWERDRAVFSMRLYHNPWCAVPLSPEVFHGFAQFKVMPSGEHGDETIMAWSDMERVRFALP